MYMWWKDISERFIALLIFIILSPFLIIIAILVMVDSPGSPVFHQERVGKDRRGFTIYKFRTMYRDNDDSKYKAFLRKFVLEGVNSEADITIEMANKPRTTRVGAILRKTNLDELPQLINIIKGDMAFVGPRPDIPFAVEMYQRWHLKRFGVKPGVTGLWQVSGRRQTSFEEMINLDLEYVKKHSLFLDVKILLLTMFTILRRDS